MGSALNTILSRSLNYNQLNKPYFMPGIYDMTNGRNRPSFYNFVAALNATGTRSRQVASADKKFEFLKQNNQYVACPIQSTTLVGGNLVITLTDPTYDVFRNNFVVRDKVGNAGYVIAHAPGSITIAPYGSTTSFNTSTMFLAGQTAYQGESNNPKGGYGLTMESMFVNPVRDYNYLQKYQDSITIDREDLYQTYLNDAAGTTAQSLTMTYQEQMMAARFAFQLENSLIRGERSVNTINGKTIYQNGGLDWAIAQNGGWSDGSASVPTLSTYKQHLEYIRDNGNVMSGDIIWIGGTKARSRFFTTLQNQIQFAATTTQSGFGTNGRSGLDIAVFTWLGLKMAFMDMPLFNDPAYNGNISSITGDRIVSDEFYCMSLRDVMDAETGEMIPPIQMVHFDPTPIVRYRYSAGSIDASGNVTGGGTAGSATQVSELVDSVTVSMQYDGGVNIPNTTGMTHWYLNS